MFITPDNRIALYFHSADLKPEHSLLLGSSLTGVWIQTTGVCIHDSLIERMINNFKCKVCGHVDVGKVTIITSHPVETICEACQRDEKIENLLNGNR